MKKSAKRAHHIDVHNLLRQEALDYVKAHIDLCKSVGLDQTIVIVGEATIVSMVLLFFATRFLDELEKLSDTGLRAAVLESNPGRISVTWTLE